MPESFDMRAVINDCICTTLTLAVFFFTSIFLIGTCNELEITELTEWSHNIYPCISDFSEEIMEACY